MCAAFVHKLYFESLTERCIVIIANLSLSPAELTLEGLSVIVRSLRPLTKLSYLTHPRWTIYKKQD